MTIQVFDFEQRSAEWEAARCGLLTASSIGALLTVASPDPVTVICPACGVLPGEPCVSAARKIPTPIKTVHGPRTETASLLPPAIRTATTDTARNLTATLAAERINGWADDTWQSFDMLRGVLDEPVARDLYSRTWAPVVEVGLIVRDFDGVRIGYSPDGLVGSDGLIEVKSRRPKNHLATILDDQVPADNMAQIQCGLLVSGRNWCDYVSISGGMKLWRKRVHPDQRWHDAILAAAQQFEADVARMVAVYEERTDGLPATERNTYDQEMRVA